MSEVTLESQLIEIIKDEEMAEHIKLAKIDMLIRLGVNVNAMYGAKSLLKLANEVNEPKIIEFIKEKGGKDIFDEEIAQKLGWDLIEVCNKKDGDIEKVNELVDMGADVNAKLDSDFTALMGASYKGHKEIVELLIKKGADVNQKDNNGYTALINASLKGSKEIVKLLIQNGADVNLHNIYGRTALIGASELGNKEVVELLIQHGADVNQKNIHGQNAMFLASDETRKVIINAVKKRNIKENGTIIGSIKNLFERQEI